MKYRPEVDGLRAVAVTPVILYHASPALVPAGFAGVDIFFVISGYLITSLLAADLERGTFSLWDFYERRARRILPALFAMMAAVFVLARDTMLPSQFQEFCQSLVATLLFLSNVFFWQTTDYFGFDVETLPLLHTWSLAVEEQFYVLFPPLLWLVWRFGRGRLLILLSLAAVVSLMLAHYAAPRYPVPNFYLAPTRAWELLAGAIASLLIPVPERRTARAQLFSLAGLAMILASFWVFRSVTPWPGLYTVLPVVGTVLVLRYAVTGTLVARLLSLKPMVAIGLLSYSAYLWHQPLFALARLRFSSVETLPMAGAIILLTFACAWLSYRYVETPFRRRTGAGAMPVRRMVVLVTAGAGVLATVSVLSLVELAQGRFRFQTLAYDGFLIHPREARLESWHRFVRNPELKDQFSRFEGDAPVKVLVVGDSHAKDMFNLLHLNREAFPGTAFRYAFFEGGCMAPASPRRAAEDTRACIGAFISDRAALFAEATHVLLSQRWIKFDADILEAMLPAAIESFQAAGKGVVLLSNSEEFAPDPTMLMARMMRQGETSKSQADSALFAARRPKVADLNQRIAALAARHEVVFLSKQDFICDPVARTCEALTDTGQAVFPDASHYTLAGAAYLGRRAAEMDWLAPLRVAQ